MARPIKSPADLTHGLYTTYTNWGCRCEACNLAHTERCRFQRESRAARLAAFWAEKQPAS